MARPLIVHYGNDPAYLAIVWELARLEDEAGRAPVLLDLTDVLSGIGDATNRRVLRLAPGSQPDERFGDAMRDAGFTTYAAASLAARGGSYEFDTAATEAIRETTHSAIVSFSRDPEPEVRRGVYRRLQRDLLRGASKTYRAVSVLLADHPDIDEVYVMNGRFPHQRAVLEAARAAGRRIRHYEKGEQPDTYWNSPHSTLDRHATQGSVDEVLEPYGPDEALRLGRTWMERRVSGGTNIYSRFFDADDAGQSGGDERVIGFFTSSQDEFAALGPEWHVESWADQYEAFETVLDAVAGAGYRAYLRVHPNFATKSHASFLREGARIRALQQRYPDVTIIWHDEKVNSYALVGSTDVVVVWDSTIGLEASARGKPVWEMAASYYDLYADVRPWFGHESTPEARALEYVVDPERAIRFMGYLEVREPALSADAVAFRSTLLPANGPALRLAQLLSTGGAPRVGIALRSIVDVVRHRRASINAKAARQFTGRRS